MYKEPILPASSLEEACRAILAAHEADAKRANFTSCGCAECNAIRPHLEAQKPAASTLEQWRDLIAAEGDTLRPVVLICDGGEVTRTFAAPGMNAEQMSKWIHHAATTPITRQWEIPAPGKSDSTESEAQ